MEKPVEDVAPIPGAILPPPPPPPPREARGRDLLIGVGIIWGADLLIGLVLMGIGGGRLENIEPAAIVAVSMVGLGVTAFVSWRFVCRRYGRTLVDGFALRPVGRKAVVAAALTGLVGAIAASVLVGLFGTGKSFMDKLVADPAAFALVALFALCAPFAEELYYRGFLFPVLRRKLGAAAGLVLVTVWFATAHASQLAGDWVGLPVIAAMGLVWTLLRHRSDSLIPSITSHLTYNAVLVAISVIDRIAK